MVAQRDVEILLPLRSRIARRVEDLLEQHLPRRAVLVATLRVPVLLKGQRSLAARDLP
jgi:hypothetical protein